MKKRVLSMIVMCALLVVAMVGCGGTAADADSIKIGGLAPLTGDVSLYGINCNNGVKLAVEEINAAGGINGKKIDYIVYDEKGDATEAVTAYNKLVSNDNVVALIGDVTSTPCLAVAQVAVQDNLPMITATGTAKDITLVGDNVFRACFIDPYQGELMASYAYNVLGAKTAAILYDTSSDYSVGLTDTFVAQAQALGLNVVAKEGYTAGDVDFKAQLTKIAGQNPDVLFLPEYYEDIALIAPQARDAGVAATLLGADGWDSVVENMDASSISAVEGSYFCAHASLKSTDPDMVAFVELYTETYGEAPNMFAALGYDAAKILFAAIDAADSTDADAIIAALNATDYAGLTGNVTYDANGDPIKSAAIMTITNGDYAFVETYDK